MKLKLDHTQRLNLCALIGGQRASTIEEGRMWWRLLDRIELNEEERKEIGYEIGVITTQDGEIQVPKWDSRKVAVKAFTVDEKEEDGISNVITEYAKSRGIQVGGDRQWLPNLLDQFEPKESPAKVNGNASAETSVPARHRA